MMGFTTDQIKGEQPPAVDFQDGLVSVAIGVAVQLSIERDGIVTVEKVMDECKCKSFY